MEEKPGKTFTANLHQTGVAVVKTTVKKLVLSLILVVVSFSAIYSQFPQAQRGRERIEASERASADAKAGKVAAEPYRAKMNIDVQMVLARQDVKTFAEAKPLAVKQVADGEPLWMYIKIVNGTLGKWLYKTAGDNSEERHLMAVEIAPQGDMMAKSHYILSFNETEMQSTEVKVALTSGLPGRNRSLPILLRAATAPVAKPAIVPLEMRLLNEFGFPRGPSEYLAKAPLAIDLTKGAVKYQAMLDLYDASVLRGSGDKSKAPVDGKYDDNGIRARLMNELGDSGVEPDKLWFAADEWLEYSTDPTSMRQLRVMPAAFTYKRDGACFYGVVEITQPFEMMNNRYGASTFKIDRDIPTACTQ